MPRSTNLAVFHARPRQRLPAAPAEPLRPSARVRSLARSPRTNTQISGHWGAIGAFIQGNDALWLLTANHVIAANGKLTHFPQDKDGVRAGNPPVLVSREVRWIPLRPGPDAANLADAAICKVDRSYEPALPLYPEEWRMCSGKPVRPDKGERVFICDRNQVQHIGTVVESSGNCEVVLDLNGVIDRASFSDQILIEKLAGRFVNPGDSGSLVVVERGGRMFPAGIAFGTSTLGRSPRYAVVAPLEHVLAGLSADTGGAPEILV